MSFLPLEIITSTPPNSKKSQNERKKTIKLVFISLSLTHRPWGGGGGGGGIIQKQDGDANCTFIQRGQVPTFEGGKCPSPHIS